MAVVTGEVQSKLLKFQATTSNGSSNTCKQCNKRVYDMEKLVANGIVYHKTCFRCAYCNNILSIQNYTFYENVLYCKPHFLSLFKATGNYKAFENKKEGDGLKAERPKFSVETKLDGVDGGERKASGGIKTPSRQYSGGTVDLSPSLDGQTSIKSACKRYEDSLAASKERQNATSGSKTPERSFISVKSLMTKFQTKNSASAPPTPAGPTNKPKQQPRSVETTPPVAAQREAAPTFLVSNLSRDEELVETRKDFETPTGNELEEEDLAPAGDMTSSRDEEYEPERETVPSEEEQQVTSEQVYEENEDQFHSGNLEDDGTSNGENLDGDAEVTSCSALHTEQEQEQVDEEEEQE